MNTTKKESRRHVQNRNRSANKWGLRPFAPTLSLATTTEVARLTAHVQNVIETRPEWPTPVEDAACPPNNGYDYRRDALPGFSDRANKPKGSNAWPHNRKLACCGKSEKLCDCGTWRRYF